MTLALSGSVSDQRAALRRASETALAKAEAMSDHLIARAGDVTPEEEAELVALLQLGMELRVREQDMGIQEMRDKLRLGRIVFAVVIASGVAIVAALVISRL